METGYDIIFLWVARMIMLGLYDLGDIPFSVVYLHGTVRNEHGQRMSKSLGTGVDPLEVVEQYGADALRYTLITSSGPGNDMRLSEQRVEAGRNFANKLWNAARFVISMIGDERVDIAAMPARCRRGAMRRSRTAGSSRASKGSHAASMSRCGSSSWARPRGRCTSSSGASSPTGTSRSRRCACADDAQARQPSPLPVLAYVLERCLRLLHPVDAVRDGGDLAGAASARSTASTRAR